MCHTQQYNTHLHTKVLPFYFFYHFPIFISNFLLICLSGYSRRAGVTCKSVPQLFSDIIYQKWNSISNNFRTLVALGCHVLPKPMEALLGLKFFLVNDLVLFSGCISIVNMRIHVSSSDRIFLWIYTVFEVWL